MSRAPLRKPAWLRRKLPSVGAGGGGGGVRATVEGLNLHTVCREARCPNRMECAAGGTATFLLLGPSCTRACAFCAVDHTPPGPPDPDEPRRVAQAAARLGLDYCVLTMVTRDDLPDGGASHVAACVEAVRAALPGGRVEVLISDLGGDAGALARVLAAGPAVLNHNLETIPRLYPRVRPQADYGRSLEVLDRARGLAPGVVTKSGLMLGLGEEREEVLAVLADLRAVGCASLTLGQYLAPSDRHHPVRRYLPPDEFAGLDQEARALGFKAVASGPLVRSSYQAHRGFAEAAGEALP